MSSRQQKSGKAAKGRQPKKTQKTKKNRQANRNGVVRAQRPVLHLSPCARTYAQAKLDPFGSMHNEMPCIPDLFDLPSQKVCTLLRGTASTNTNGFGFIMASSDWNSNNSAVVWSSQTTFSGASQLPLTPVAGTSTTSDSRFPYALSNPRSHRIVAAGIRFRYIGTELNRGGRVAGLVTNHDGNAPSALTMTQVLALPEAKNFTVDRKWKTMIWNPAYAGAFNYDTGDYSLGAGSPGNSRFIVIFEGVASQSFYEWELVGYHELVSNGSDTTTNPTRSHSDLPGLSLVRDFLADEAVQSVGSSAFQQFLGWAKSAALTTASTYIGAPSMTAPLLQWK